MKIVSPGRLRRTQCAAVVLVVTGCGTQTAGGDSQSGSSDDPPVVLKDALMLYVDDDHAEIGIHVEGKFTPDRDGTTTGAATLDMAGRSTTASFLYPPNWDTDQWPPDAQQSLRSGHAMAVQASRETGLRRRSARPAADLGALPHGRR